MTDPTAALEAMERTYLAPLTEALGKGEQVDGYRIKLSQFAALLYIGRRALARATNTSAVRD